MQPSMREYRRVDRRWIVWPCKESNELRGRRRSNKDKGCLLSAVRASSAPLKDGGAKMQARCKHCGNRPRLNAKDVTQFDNPQDAYLHCEELNAGLI